MPWPAITAGSSNGWQNAIPVLGGAGAGGGERLVERGPALDDRGAVRPAGLDLGDRRAGRHEDVAGHPEVLGGERQRLGVVAGAPGGHAVGGAGRRARPACSSRRGS